MTAKAWNISVFIALILSVSMIGGGVLMAYGTGPALIVSGGCLLCCVVLAALTSVKIGAK